VSATILKPQPLKKARARHIEGLLREIKHCSRRADDPEDRAALAELEREFLTIQERWITAGLMEALEPEPIK
jgi:hypothetical protein